MALPIDDLNQMHNLLTEDLRHDFDMTQLVHAVRRTPLQVAKDERAMRRLLYILNDPEMLGGLAELFCKQGVDW